MTYHVMDVHLLSIRLFRSSPRTAKITAGWFYSIFPPGCHFNSPGDWTGKDRTATEGSVHSGPVYSNKKLTHWVTISAPRRGVAELASPAFPLLN